MDASNNHIGPSRANPRIIMMVVWMFAALFSIPVSLVIKFSGENGGWLTFILVMFGIFLVGFWVFLGFIGFILGNANLPDFGDIGPATVPTWWFGNEEAASITGGIFLVVSAIGHVLWLVSCIAYAVLSHRSAPEAF